MINKKRSHRFSLKFFRVIWEEVDLADSCVAELAPRVNRQLSRATERNRIKRILREFFRRHSDFFIAGRWVFIAKPQLEGVPNREVWWDLETLPERIRGELRAESSKFKVQSSKSKG